MQDADVRDSRSFALVGHSGDGKTSLGEALLHTAGATRELGSVDQGSSVLDTLPEEKERKASVSSSLYAFEHGDRSWTLVDTPGDPNFMGDGQIALRAMDGALLVLSAVDGVKVGSDRMWRASREAGVPVLAFVNGMNRERADFEAALESLRKLDANPVALTLPVGAAGDFRGVIDLVAMKLVDGSGEHEIPAELREQAQTARQQVVESAAECDDTLLERYLEEGEISDEETLAGLRSGVREGKLLPVLCGAATAELGIGPLLGALAALLPAPAERAPWSARNVDDGAEVEVGADPAATFGAVVFKTVIDRYAGKLSVFRVVSGVARGEMGVLNATTDTRERLGKLFALRGTEHVDVAAAGPGAVVAVAKLKDTHTGNVLTAEKAGVQLAELPIPQGVLSYAISAKSKGDEDKVFTSLGRIVEEDPTLHVGREASTGEFLLTGMGELHIRTTVHKLKRMFEVEVELKTPKVPYRETIMGRAENVEGKLKKQTGGKGMFGVCYLSVEPLPRGAGFEFVDEIVGGAIPRGLIPAVEKGIRESMDRGPLAGHPVVDIRVRCIDGKHHSVDSNEMAFKLAGSFGFKAAVEQAKPTLLEPVMNVEVSAPDQFVGDIMGDLSSRRGRVQATEARGSVTVIQAQVPMSEMLEYPSTLTSITGGQGAVHMEFSHYDEVPAQIRERLVAESKAGASQAS